MLMKVLYYATTLEWNIIVNVNAGAGFMCSRVVEVQLDNFVNLYWETIDSLTHRLTEDALQLHSETLMAHQLLFSPCLNHVFYIC